MTKFSCGPAWLLAASAMAAVPAAATTITQARQHIKHVIIIMQENRSFDHYFGTYPKADGIPVGVCVPFDTSNPSGGCVAPFYDPNEATTGGPHGAVDAQADLDDGITTAKMDGFVAGAERVHTKNCKSHPNGPNCPGPDPQPDVMGYHTQAELPNYWSYARNFVLQDRMFESVRAYSLNLHVDLTSQWTALCTDDQDQTTCSTTQDMPRVTTAATYPWADFFHLLDSHAVSWKYYLGSGLEPDCADGQDTCDPEPQLPQVGTLWDPVPNYKYIKSQGSDYLATHNPDMDQLLVDLKTGGLPQVSWVIPQATVSEHPRNGSDAGQDYVTSMVNAVMESPYWDSTVIFLAWDDWGGFYDHVVPPIAWTVTDTDTPVEGFGLRVPAMTISPWVKAGRIDHQTLSFENYASFIENLFMDGARLDPAKLGLPDSRPVMPDTITTVSFPDGHTETVGDLVQEFNFSQTPIKPLILSTHIPTHIAAGCDKPGYVCADDTAVISWAALTGPNIATTFTYHVTEDGAEVPACTTTGTSCTLTAASGSHVYRVYSVDPDGVISPNSAAATLVSP